MVQSERVLLELGLGGRWQLRTASLYLLVIFINGPTYLFNNFAMGKVAYECMAPPNATVTPDQCWYSPANESGGGGRTACSAWHYSPAAVDSSLVGKLDLVCERAFLKDWDNSVMMAGQLFGSVVATFLSDAFGRRTGSIIVVTGSMLCHFGYLWAPSFAWLAVFRFVESSCSLGCYAIPFTALSEITLGNFRTVLGVLSIVCFGLSNCIAAVISYFLREWQHYTLAIALMNVPSVLLLLFLTPESPRWLYAKGHYAKFRDIINHMQETNKIKISEDLQQEINDLVKVQTKSQFLQYRVKEASVGMLEDLRRSKFWMLFSTWRLCGRMAVLCYIWSANIVIFYAFLFGSELFQVDIHIYTFIAGFFDIPAGLVCLLFVRFCGRRWGNSLMLGLTCASAVGTCFVTPGAAPLALAYLVPALGRTLISGAFLNLYLWHVELMPTIYRNVGLGIGSASGRVAGIFFPYLDNLKVYWPPMTSATLAVMSLVAAVLSLLLPETQGQLLPDTIEEADLFGTSRYKHLAQPEVNVRLEVNDLKAKEKKLTDVKDLEPNSNTSC